MLFPPNISLGDQAYGHFVAIFRCEAKVQHPIFRGCLEPNGTGYALLGGLEPSAAECFRRSAVKWTLGSVTKRNSMPSKHNSSSRAKLAQNRIFEIFGSAGSRRNLSRSIGLFALCIFHQTSTLEAHFKAISWPFFVLGQSPTPEMSRMSRTTSQLLCFERTVML